MYSFKSKNVFAESVYAGTSNTIYDLPAWFLKSNFSRNSSDLIAELNGDKIILVDFFTNYSLPNIQTENGLFLKGSILNYLAGPLAKGQYTQSSESEILSIGEVSSVTGTVKALRLDGSNVNLNIGDPVFQGDTIETVGSAAVGLVFLDKTTLSLSEGGKMVLDELVYDPATGNGSMAVNMVEGAFSFISGEIAKTGPDAMTIETPVGTMGIRGTTVAGKAAVEGNENSFTLLQDADGGVGQISVSNAAGTQVLSQVGATTVVSSINAAPPTPIILSAAQIQANYGTALNVLPPTPAVAPQPQAAPPPQEEQDEQVQEEESEENTEEEIDEEGSSEEGSSEGEDDEGGEEGQTEGEEGEEDPAEGEEEAVLEGEIEETQTSDTESNDAPQSSPEEESSSTEESASSGETVAEETFNAALASGASPEQAMAEAAEVASLEGASSQNPSDNPVNNSNPLAVQLPGSPIIATNFNGPLGPGISGVGSPVGPMDIVGSPVGSAGLMGATLGGPGLLEILSGPTTPGFGENLLQNQIDVVQESFFFDDPSLYNNFEIEEIPESSDTNTFYINGASDFGRTISDFSLSQILTINFSFDEPSSKYSVTRSNYYEFTSTSSTTSLSWDSKPSTTAQIVNETEPNGTFGSPQVIARSRFKVTSNSDVGDDTIPWVKIQGGYINNGIDIFKIDLQAGETLTVDIDYGDGFSIDFNSYVTLWNQSLSVVAENDDSAITLGGGGSSGTEDSYLTYTTSTTESFYILVEDSPRNNNSSTRGDFVVNLSISPTSSSTGLGTSSTASVGGENKLPYLFNFTENTSNYDTKSFKSDVVSSIKYTDSVSGTGSEVFMVVGDGTNSAIWLWDDLSEGYGVSDNELSLVATLPSFDNDTLTGSEIIFGSI